MKNEWVNEQWEKLQRQIIIEEQKWLFSCLEKGKNNLLSDSETAYRYISAVSLFLNKRGQKMNTYIARHKLTGRLIEVEFKTLEEAMNHNKGFINWEKLC